LKLEKDGGGGSVTKGRLVIGASDPDELRSLGNALGGDVVWVGRQAQPPVPCSVRAQSTAAFTAFVITPRPRASGASQ
jgi:hypothetical protein